MDERMENLGNLSVEELEALIAAAQELKEEKRREEERQAEMERQRLAELERQRQAELERQRLEELERQRQAELERQRQAELERQRLEQERLEAERRKQEEIAELLKRLNELGVDVPSEAPSAAQPAVQQPAPQVNPQPQPATAFLAAAPVRPEPVAPVRPEPTVAVEPEPVAPEEPEYTSITCPKCHVLLAPDSRFCFNCGSSIGGAKQAAAPKTVEPPKPTTPPKTSSSQAAKPKQTGPKKSFTYVNDLKKWDTLSGERDVMDWKEVTLSKPKTLINGFLKVTTERILISHENMMVAQARSGLLMQALTSGNEHGKPWAMIPLESVNSFRQSGKIEITIDAGVIVKVSVTGSSVIPGKAKTYTNEVYEALKRVLPDKAV
jgi:hypothetical protein